MQSPGSQGTRDAFTPEIEEVFSLAADPQLAENSRQGSERKNRAFALGFEELKSQTMQWGSWQASGRTASVPTVYLYDGNNPLEEVDSSGNVLARYSQTTKIDEELSEVRSGTTSYYQADGPGSITSLSNGAGTLANTYTYDSFGNLTASSGTLVNPFRYTGREFDSETALYFYRARYVDSSVGRFVSEDPLGFKGGINFYAFVLNNPVNLRDPLGLKACENCTNAAPLPANSPKCDSYGSETYVGTSLKCFCKCAGDSAWSQQVRGCLACEHDAGTNPFIAHQRCYRAAGITNAPWGVISKCYQECLAQPSGPGFPNMTPF